MAKITAKRTTGEHAGKEASIDFEFGGNLQEVITKFGEPLVFQHAVASLTVALQGWLRSQLAQGKTDKEIKDAAAAWTPGQRRQGKSPAEKLRDQLEQMSPEVRAEILAKYAKNKG